jgi:hypothetical protein
VAWLSETVRAVTRCVVAHGRLTVSRSGFFSGWLQIAISRASLVASSPAGDLVVGAGASFEARRSHRNGAVKLVGYGCRHQGGTSWPGRPRGLMKTRAGCSQSPPIEAECSAAGFHVQNFTLIAPKYDRAPLSRLPSVRLSRAPRRPRRRVLMVRRQIRRGVRRSHARRARSGPSRRDGDLPHEVVPARGGGV